MKYKLTIYGSVTYSHSNLSCSGNNLHNAMVVITAMDTASKNAPSQNLKPLSRVSAFHVFLHTLKYHLAFLFLFSFPSRIFLLGELNSFHYR